MFRALVFFAILAAAVWGAVSLADHPGSVSLQWGGYRVDTSFAVLMGLVAAIAVAAALGYRFWVFLRGAPRQFLWAWRAKRRQQGYQALTRGMVAVAAGDANEARREANRANALLDEPPLTMLVSAQAAQMKGDEKAAGTFFKAMMERPETEFLGLRGLLNQAIKRGDKLEALSLARRAYRLQPKSTWVAANMFELQTQTAQWLDARVTCDDLKRQKLIGADEAKRRRAVLSYQLSQEAKARGDAGEALDNLLDAHKLAPGFIPAVADLAQHWIGQGKTTKAVKMIEATWEAEPHPALLKPYWNAQKSSDALERVRATERLAKRHPGHPESHIALGLASLEARLWGEARKHLESAIDAAGPPTPARVCRMMAELEESENGDSTRAREWLMRASTAAADPVWVCDHCGNSVGRWSVVCGKCESFDSFRWRTPPSIVSLPEGESADGELITEGPAALPSGGIEAG
jgi:HemY protein